MSENDASDYILSKQLWKLVEKFPKRVGWGGGWRGACFLAVWWSHLGLRCGITVTGFASEI